jgi:hypothetical protein
MEWWQKTELDDEDRLARKLAYWNTLFGTDDGINVLLDIKDICYASDKMELYYEILRRAGRSTESQKAALEAEGQAIGE